MANSGVNQLVGSFISSNTDPWNSWKDIGKSAAMGTPWAMNWELSDEKQITIFFLVWREPTTKISFKVDPHKNSLSEVALVNAGRAEYIWCWYCEILKLRRNLEVDWTKVGVFGGPCILVTGLSSPSLVPWLALSRSRPHPQSRRALLRWVRQLIPPSSETSLLPG